MKNPHRPTAKMPLAGETIADFVHNGHSTALHITTAGLGMPAGRYKLVLAQSADAEAAIHRAAVKTLEHLGYAYRGAELWKPPIGKRPAWAWADGAEAEAAQVGLSQDAVHDALVEHCEAHGYQIEPEVIVNFARCISELSGTDVEGYKRMFEDAVRSLAAIDEALGIDPDDAGGAAPAIEAIEDLKAKAGLILVPEAGEREQFETWAIGNGFDVTRQGDDEDDEYELSTTQCAWLTWQHLNGQAAKTEVRTQAFKDATDAISGALDFGYQGSNRPPVGHWLAEFWMYGRRQAEMAEAEWTAAARDVLAERKRQINVEGWAPMHDAEHSGGEMAEAAICYVQGYTAWHPSGHEQRWPWELGWWKPKDRRRNLIKAGALILAEIERIDLSEQLAQRSITYITETPPCVGVALPMAKGGAQ